ncbi:hypothetical protein [Desulfoluna butyratoxydans]|uniref:Uncharacterized protein n=1 Tax=Desulfoluna butyratoxydans TaxID=231438 RepID=A0A4U8YKI0_9BACT|nr:hypothetical protein [Desulfoluna butyratoxydans]VFQ44375.1 hypothetical protein MSL71_20240 [Desulfoluna butyratoxydans]
MKAQTYITRRTVLLSGGTVPPETDVELTPRQAEFLVLGGFVKLKPSPKAAPAAEEKDTDHDGNI